MNQDQEQATASGPGELLGNAAASGVQGGGSADI